MLELLSEVITLPATAHVHAAIVLDWYKRPTDDPDPTTWPNTEVGELVSRGKYNYRTRSHLQGMVGREIVGRMCRAIGRHPGIRATDVVLDVPGHDADQVSFAGRMAATVARDVEKPFIRVMAGNSFRPPAKSADPEVRAQAIRGRFSVGDSLSGMTALIVDDVFRSGESMRETARAAVVAGASLVYGICAVRTMRR
ncbi:phosphoribosyltransferase [Pseudonocardia acaciae]|uniref:phosphoribosyltransferase n=1 Tax=Pseudonocardia acaciae TaxID=551276 RepID=UPI0012ED89EB|nr:phosphoribosyltransferase [Pseudonocardia acaciae]